MEPILTLSLIKTPRNLRMNDLQVLVLLPSDKMFAMFASLRHFIGWMISACGSRRDLVLENLALRQQLLALHRRRLRRWLLCHRSVESFPG